MYSLSLLLLFIVSIPLLRNPPETIGSDKPEGNEGASAIVDLLHNPFVMLLAFGACVQFVEIYGVLTWVPVFLEEVYRYSPAQIGASATMFGIAAIPASIITGFLCTTLRRIVWLCVSGGVLASAGILVLVITSYLPLWLTVITITLITWGHSQLIVAIMSIAAIIAPTHSSGKALGLIFTFGYSGAILATYAGGYMLEKTGNHDLSFTVFSGSALVSMLVILLVSRLLQKNPPSHFKLKMSSG